MYELRGVHGVADAVRQRRRHDAHHHVDLVLIDELLGHLDSRGGDVRVVPVDERDRPVRDLLVVLIQVKRGRAAHGVAELGVHTGEGKQLADLELLARGGARRCARRDCGRSTSGERGRGARDEELAPRQAIGVPAFFGKLVLCESAHEAPSRMVRPA